MGEGGLLQYCPLTHCNCQFIGEWMHRTVRSLLALLLTLSPGRVVVSANSDGMPREYPSYLHATSNSSFWPKSSRHSYRSSKARTEFKHLHPCPANGRTSGKCPGYIINHVNPLKRGGADASSNMQWQTREAAKAKDKWE